MAENTSSRGGSSKGYFAQVAGDWDRMRAGFYSENVRQSALALAGIDPASVNPAGIGPDQPDAAGLSAADLGAGTGFVTEALLAAGLKVFAVDQSPAMLAELAGKFANAASPHRLTVLQGMAEALPLPDASVDFVFANMFLHHVDDPAVAIAEMARVVRPGGRVVLTDLDRHSHEFLLTEHHDRWPGFDRADVSGWLSAAGLAEARVDCVGQRCCADSCDGSQAASISIFAAHGLRPVCPNAPEDADPEAVGLRARAFFEASAPLLCAESVLLAVAQALGARSPLVPRLASGLCSGLARTCGPCGALTGGVLALGLALGRESGRDSLEPVYAAVQEYTEWFSETQPSAECFGLTGCDFRTPEGQLRFREGGVKQGVCLPLVQAAAARVMRILAEQ